LHGLCPSSGKENAFAESTLDLDNNGRKWFCELVNVSQRLPERLRFGGLFLCLNVSWLIERVRGSRFRAARGRREDFAEADRHLRKSPAGYRCLPVGVATASNPANIDSTTNANA
jgi:hypothetical protein